MDSDKVLALWLKAQDAREGQRLGHETMQEYFAALIQQQTIADGWRSLEQVKKAVEDEREACAKVCEDEKLVDSTGLADDIAYDCAVNDCAAAIENAPLP